MGIKNKSKKSLSTEQSQALNRIHTAEIILEIALVAFLISLFTINITSAAPFYGVFVFIVLFLSSILLFAFGISTTIAAVRLKRFGNPLLKRTIWIRRWALIAWCCIPIILLLTIFNSPVQGDQFNLMNLLLIGLVTIVMFAALICFLVKIQLLWRSYNMKKPHRRRIIIYGIIAAIALILAIFGSYTTTEVINFKSTTITDATLELGQSEVRQIGREGSQETRHNLLFGFPLSTSKSDPMDEIVAQGGRRYQYMYCSNGSYRYYPAEQFKDPNVGFTHQSPDFCAQNGAGTQTTIADVPPPEKAQAPVYNNYYSPRSYTTTCSSYTFSNSVTCTSY